MPGQWLTVPSDGERSETRCSDWTRGGWGSRLREANVDRGDVW